MPPLNIRDNYITSFFKKSQIGDDFYLYTILHPKCQYPIAHKCFKF